MQCACNDEITDVDCTGANLTVVPIFLNPDLRRLSVQNNHLHHLEGGLGFYKKLVSLDLSHNYFQHVGRDQFSSQSQLQLLNLSNNLLTQLHENSFQGLDSLQTLDLSSNALSTLPNDTFAGLESLTELRLKENELHVLAPSAFRGMSRLRILHMENNRLATLSPSWLAPLENLRALYASGNLILDLPPDAFKALRALREVALDNNMLRSAMSPEAFRGCRALDTLDLSHNKFESVPGKALSQVTQLSSLDLSANPVIALDRTSFKNMFVLKVLRLNNMSYLATISGDAFRDNLKLTELYLENNPYLDPLPWGIFESNANLQVLSVRNNEWTTLSPLQIPQNSLRSLYVEGLPLYCNCSITWLWKLYQKNDLVMIELDQVTCASISANPPEQSNTSGGGVAGDPLAQMSKEQLICPDWSSLLLAISVATMVTVLLLVVAALAVYKCRRYRLRRRGATGGAAFLHIKDDTMVYKSTLLTTQHYDQNYTKPSTAFSPVPSEQEPFYEVPKYATVVDDVANPKSTTTSSSSACSKYSYNGADPWGVPLVTDGGGAIMAPPPESTAHGYANPAQQRIVAAFIGNGSGSGGSPRSSSTSNTGLSSSSNSSSTASNGRPMFYSPAAAVRGGTGKQQQAANTLQWQQFPHSPAKYTSSVRQQPQQSLQGSKTLMLQQYSPRNNGSSAHSSPRRSQMQQPQMQQPQMQQLQQQQQQQHSLRSGGKRSHNSSGLNLYV